MKRAWVVGVGLFAWLVAGEVIAQTQAPGASSAFAEALFRDGRKLMEQENYPEACVKFAESQRLEPKIGTLLNLGVCHEAQGRTATAWAELTSVVTLAQRRGDTKREAFAKQRLKALTLQLSHITVTADRSVTVTLDGEGVTDAMLNTPLPIDPGVHVVAVTAPGKRAWSTQVTIARERSQVTVDVPDLEDDVKATPAPVVVPAPVPAPVSTEATPASSATGINPVAVTSFIVGGAGLTLGIITGAVAWSQASTLADACPAEQCPADQVDALAEANALSNVANVGFIVAGVGATVGLLSLVLWQDEHDEANVGVGLGSARFRMSF